MNDYEQVPVPGMTVLSRKGTALHTAMGAASHWHERYQRAHRAAWLRYGARGFALGIVFTLLGAFAYASLGR